MVNTLKNSVKQETELKIISATARKYPFYSSVKCQLVRKGTTTPIPSQTVQFSVKGEGSSSEYEKVREETTDKDGYVTFEMYLSSKYSNKTWQPQIVNNELIEHTDRMENDNYKVTGYDSLNLNPYSANVFDTAPGKTVNYKVEFVSDSSNPKTEDIYSSDTTLIFSGCEKTGTVNWNKQVNTSLKIIKYVRTNENAASTNTMILGVLHNINVMYTDDNGVGIPNAVIRYNVTNTSSSSINGRGITKLSTTDDSSYGTIVTNSDGIAWLAIKGKSPSDVSEVTFSSTIRDDSTEIKNNLYPPGKTATLKIKWVTPPTYYINITSSSTFKTGSGVLQINGKVYGTGTLPNFIQVTSNSGTTKQISVSSDGTFSYSDNPTSSTTLEGLTKYTIKIANDSIFYVIMPFYNRSIISWDSSLSEDIPVLKRDNNVNIKLTSGLGTALSSRQITVEISHTKKSQESSSNNKVYKIYKTITTNSSGIATLSLSDIKYAGTYVFKFYVATSDKNIGTWYVKNGITFRPLKTSLTPTYTVYGNREVFTHNQVDFNLKDEFGNIVPGGYIKRTLIPENGELRGIIHIYDKIGVKIPKDKTYTYPAILTSINGNFFTYFLAFNEPNHAKLSTDYMPGDDKDTYSSCYLTVYLDWIKYTPTLTVTSSNKTPYVTNKGEVTATLAGKKEPSYTVLPRNDTTKDKVGGIYYENNPDITFLEIPLTYYNTKEERYEVDMSVKPLGSKKISSILSWDTTGVTSTYSNTGTSKVDVNTNDSTGQVNSWALPTNKGGIKATFKYTYAGDSVYNGKEGSIVIEWKKIPTAIELTDPPNIYVKDKGFVVATLKKTTDSKAISGKIIKISIKFNETIDGAITHQLDDANTNTSGQVTGAYTVTSKGGVTGIFTFSFAGDDIYISSSKTSGNITWKKIPTLLSIEEQPTNTTVTDPITAKVKLVTNKPSGTPTGVNEASITTNLINLTSDITGTNSDKNEITSRNKTLTLPSITTNSNGVAETTFTVTSKGDISGTFSFSYSGGDIYEAAKTSSGASVLNSNTITWAKIKNLIYKYSNHTKDINGDPPLVGQHGSGVVQISYKIGNNNSNNSKLVTDGLLIHKQITLYEITYDGNKYTLTNTPIKGVKGKETTNGSIIGPSGADGVIGLTSSDVTNGYVSANFIPTSHGNINGVFKFSNEANELYEKSSGISFTELEHRVCWYKRDVTIELYDYPKEDLYVGDAGFVTVQIKDAKDNTPIANTAIDKEYHFKNDDGANVDSSFPDTIISKKEETDSEGKITSTYINKTMGNVHAIYGFQIKDDPIYNDLALMEIEKDIVKNKYVSYWKKIPTKFTLISHSTPQEVTLPGQVKVRLNETIRDGQDSLGKLKGVNVTVSVVWTDKDKPTGNTVTSKVTGQTVTVNATNQSETETDSNRCVIGKYIPKNIGDIIGKISFKFSGDDIYESCSITDSVTWNKIHTEISEANDVEVYDGRYTNLHNHKDSNGNVTVDWTKASPGVDEKYKTFEATVRTLNTKTTILAPHNEYISYYTWQNQFIFKIGKTDVNGYAYGRWTRKYDIKEKLEYDFRVRFDETDIFYESEDKIIAYDVLPRITTTLAKYIYEPENYRPDRDKKQYLYEEYNNEGIRYNVPFDFGAILSAGKDKLAGQTIHLTFDGKEIGDKITNSEGIAQRKEYVVKDVKECQVVAKFDENDFIDKYLPKTLAYNIYIAKDYTILEVHTDPEDKIYDDCGDAKLVLTLTDSLRRGIADKIFMFYDDGTYVDPTWIKFLEEYTTSNDDGEAEYFVEAYSGIRLIRALFKETWCYFASRGNTEVEYDLNHTYTKTVSNGIVEIPIECILDSTKGLPSGLYDVYIEYTPPTTENGKCTLYLESGTVKQPMRKKIATRLVQIGTNNEVEAGLPLFQTVALKTLANEYLKDEIVNSKIGTIYSSVPNHITDSEGKIYRGYTDKKIDFYNDFVYTYYQTRKYMSYILTVTTHTKKIKPTIEPTEKTVTSVRGTEVPLQAKLYYKRLKYDKYGQEVKKADGKQIYHNPLAKDNTEYPEYYYIEDGEKKATTKTVYDNAESQETTTLIKNKKILWKYGSRVLTSAVTNENGIATSNEYTRNKVGTIQITAEIEEDDKYQAVSEKITLNTLELYKPYFEQSSIKSTTYKHSTELGAYLKYKDENGTIHVIPDATVTFSHQYVNSSGKKVTETLGTATTNSSGYAKINHIVATEISFTYGVNYVRTGNKSPYDSANDNFTMAVNPQTPQLTISSNNTSPSYGTEITLTVTFKEDSTSGAAPIITDKMKITSTDSNNKTTTIKTDSTGKGTLKFKPDKAGTIKITAQHDKTEIYNSVSSSVNVTVSKIATMIEEVLPRTDDMGNDLYVILKEKVSGDVIPYHTVKFYEMEKDDDGKFTNEKKHLIDAETDENGKAIGSGAMLEIDTHRIYVEFEGSDEYEPSHNNYDLETHYLITTCNDPREWDLIIEDWYASDGSSEYGVDINKINDSMYTSTESKAQHYSGFTGEKGTGTYKWNSRPVNELDYSHLLLRNYCDDIRKGKDWGDEGMYAHTGQILVNKYIKTTTECKITYQIKFFYDVGYKPAGRQFVPNEFGLHFGLMNHTHDEDPSKYANETAEFAKVRFETYRTNSYCMIDNELFKDAKGNNVHNIYAYCIEPNTWYDVVLNISNNTAEYSISPVYDKNGKLIQGTLKYVFPKDKKDLVGLHPYIFTFTNGTETRIRKIMIEVYKK